MMRRHLSILLAVAHVATAPVAPGTAPPVHDIELFFEVKLLLREKFWGRRVEVDQWTGGRLRMHGVSSPDGSKRYEIAGVLESPWTFRWYPTEDEAKLGAAVHVEHPEGDAYGTLAPELERLARSKHALWWDADPSTPGPPWSADNGRFWSHRHAKERDEKDPLAEQPTYPFHVLGSLEGRFAFSVRDGAVSQVVERVTRPWLKDGWQRARNGETVDGYGFWGSKRPRWEPRTYETLAAVLQLLGPAPEKTSASQWSDPVAQLAEVLATMQPRAARVSRGWTASGEDPRVRVEDGRTLIEIEGGVTRRDDLRFRLWRCRTDGSDELQILLDDRGAEAFKLWVRVGYFPAAVRPSGSPSTNALISSRTRR